MIWSKLWLGIAGPLALWVAGCGVAAWVPEIRRQPLLARAAHAYLLGAAAVGALSYLLSWGLGVPLDRPLFLGLALAGALSALLRRFRDRSESAGAERPWRAPEVAVLAVLAVATLGLVAEAVSEPVVDFDGRMTWGSQARFVRHEASVLPAALTDERVFAIHPRYPLLLPILQVVAVDVPGATWDDGIVRVVYALFLPALGVVLLSGLRSRLGARAASLGVAAVTLLPAIAWGLEGGARSTYSDLPLAAFLGGALVLASRSRLSAAGGVAAGLLAAAAVLTKQEGAILAGALALGCAFGSAGRRLRATRAGWWLSACYLLAVGLWLLWRREIPNRNDEAYLESLLGAPRIGLLADRAEGVARAVLATLADWREWGLLAPLLALAALCSGRSWWSTRTARLATILLAVQAAMISAAYLSAPDVRVVGSTFGRFLVQAAAPMAILLALSTRAALSRHAAGRAGRGRVGRAVPAPVGADTRSRGG